jgi:propionyl-CoA synthetase
MEAHNSKHRTFHSELYDEMYNEASGEDTRDGFWRKQAEKVHWDKFPDTILDASNHPFYKWYPDGEINICYNALDRHVNDGRGEQLALIYDSAYTNSTKKFTYSEVLEKVSKLAKILQDTYNIEKGDRVVIFMPMIPEATFAMLACARIGAIHSVVFGGFAAKELSNRIDDCKPKLIITASCGLEPSKIIRYVPIVDEALEISQMADCPRLIVQRHDVVYELNLNPDVYKDYHEEMQKVKVGAECVPVNSNHELYILYTSGTTGQPKGIVRDTGGTVVGLNYIMDIVFNIQPGDVWFSGSDVGWVVGHSFIVYGPLIRGGTTIVYEGKPVGTPDPGAFWRLVEQYKPHSIYCAPTAIRVIKKEDYKGEYIKKYDLSSLKSILLVGERCDPDTINWLESKFPHVLLNDTWWQTETGWPICSNFGNLHMFPTNPGSCTKVVPGYEVHILDDNNEPVEPPTLGKVSIKCPPPPSFMLTLWGNDEAFKQKYFSDSPGYYTTGDAGYFNENGYLHIMTRTDDVINTAGHRLSTGRFEEVINEHPLIVESAVVGVWDSVRGEQPFALVIPASGIEYNEETLKKEIIAKVREDIGAFARLGGIIIVNRLPKTRSGKILRGTIKSIANKKKFTTPATIEDASVLDEIRDQIMEALK